MIDAKKRGVHVRVMLNPARRSGQSENAETHKKLKAAGIEVLHSNPAFDVTHEKSMVVDDATAYVKSLNWDIKNLTETRDDAVVTTHEPEVKEVIECFEADWHRKPCNVDQRSLLMCCSGNGRDRIARFIVEAKHPLFVQNERYQECRDHRASGARQGTRRESARDGAPSAQIEKGEVDGRRWWVAHSG